MVQHLPNSGDLDVRDYLFVDRQRVGSLLSQFSNGLPEERNESSSRSSKLKASLASVFSIESEKGRSDSQTLALADLHVSQLEETAEALGMLGDVSDQLHSRKHWLRGKIRNKIEPGMLLRATAPTQISDIRSIATSFDRLEKALGRDSLDNAFEMMELAEALYGDSITISIRSVSEDDFDTAFVGELPLDYEFGPMRKELLLSQVGPAAVELTSLMQVAAVPTEQDREISLSQWNQKFETLSNRLFDGGNEQLDRRQLDQLMILLSGMMAHCGFVSSPRWPAISVLPLAIYRNVAPIPNLNEE